MTTNTNQPTNNQTQKPTTLIVTERFKLQSKSFRVTAYKLPDGKTTVTVRQMAITVRKQPKTAKDFLEKLGISPITAQMPNCCVADMVYLSTVIDYFRYLNESGRGNIRTLLGQEFLTKHLEEEAENNR